MVAAGLDTLPGNINMTIAYLSSDHGQEIQKRMYDEIIKSYPGEDPWHACLIEEKSEFVVSFVKVSHYLQKMHLSSYDRFTDSNTGGLALLVNAKSVIQSWKYERHHLPRCNYSSRNTIFAGK